MKKFLLLVFFTMIFPSFLVQAENEKTELRIFDKVVFYDGYLMNNNPDKDLQDGVLRHSCSLYATKLTEDELNALGEELDIRVTVKACCDNYDRIGNINIAFVEKGKEKYDPSETPRIEIGRFITPFMDMNRNPKEVPYAYEMDYLSPILRDKEIRAKYDLWMEFELFGVPYAANQQIKGCEGRSDVFMGTLDTLTSEPAGETEGNIIIPVVIKKPEYIGGNLNNYNENATDELGKTVKTYTFEVPRDLYGSEIVLITSNHGANVNGEEYNRRWHFVYFDDEPVLTYRPGRDSCEPFRPYNTQSNGIYGTSKKSDAVWQSFSNWCPGDVIDTRIIGTDNLTAGEHKIRIEVPDAVFADGEGDIPVSIYVHGSTSPEAQNSVNSIFEDKNYPLQINAVNGIINILTEEDIERVIVYSLKGEKIHLQYNNDPIDLNGIKGVVIVCVELFDGINYSGKVQL